MSGWINENGEMITDDEAWKMGCTMQADLMMARL